VVVSYFSPLEPLTGALRTGSGSCVPIKRRAIQRPVTGGILMGVWTLNKRRRALGDVNAVNGCQNPRIDGAAIW
jgi:hypothetical protein